MEESFPSDGGEAPIDLPASAAGGSSAPQARLPKEPQIEFLCPNGHHLHGPASLQGRPGACPECGSRFRIPVIDEAQEESPPEQIELPSSLGGDETGSATAKLAQGAAGRRSAGTADIVLREAQPASAPSRQQPAAPQGHPLAELLTQLWATKAEQSQVEVRLTGGESLAPQSFVKGLSRGSYAVFGVKADNGNWTVTVVRWDAIERVVLKDLKTLPA